jgi:hypothetical protein
LERETVEFGIADNVTRGIDQGDSVSGGDACLIGQRVGIHPRAPLGRQKSRLTGEIVGSLLRDARMQLVVDDDDNRDDHNRDDRERLKKQSVRELHERSLTFLMR